MKEQYAGLVAEIIEMVSESAAGLIVDNWGGVRLYIPKRYNPDHSIARLLEAEDMRKLIYFYGGETLSIPRNKTVSNKKARIIDGLQAGKPHRIIAREVEVSQRYVEKISMMLRAAR